MASLSISTPDSLHSESMDCSLKSYPGLLRLVAQLVADDGPLPRRLLEIAELVALNSRSLDAPPLRPLAALNSSRSLAAFLSLNSRLLLKSATGSSAWPSPSSAWFGRNICGIYYSEPFNKDESSSKTWPWP